MERKFVILYCVLAAVATIVLIVHGSLGQRADGPVEPGGPRARLSAITGTKTAETNPTNRDIEAEIAALEAKRLRLRKQLDAQRTTGTTSGDGEYVPVDLESFCAHYGFVMKSFPSLRPSGALVSAIDLSGEECAAVESASEKFLERLQALDRASMRVVEANDEQIRLSIPYRVDGREALFEEFRGELLEILGPGRARVAAEALYRNELIGSASCEKDFEIRKTSDGNFQISAQIIPTLAFFPGTTVPYDGTPGVEPEVYTARSIKSETSIDAAASQRMLGGLIDVAGWRARTEP